MKIFFGKMISRKIIFLQGAFDYCAGLGGVLPSFDFFDYYNQFGEAPRTSNTTAKNSTTEEVESDAGSNRASVNNPELDLDTSEFEVCENLYSSLIEKKIMLTSSESSPVFMNIFLTDFLKQIPSWITV